MPVDDDVAVILGSSRCGTGKGTDWVEQRGLGGSARRRWGSLGWQVRSIEQMSRFDEHGSSSRGSVCRVADRRCGLSTAWVTFSGVVAAILVRDETLFIVLEVVAIRVAFDVVSDVTVERRGLGLERRGCGSCRGSVSRLGRVCRRVRDAGGSFSAGGRVVVAVDDDVGVVDGGCVGVINGDVAALGGVLGCSTRLCVAVSVVWGVAWVLESMVEIVVVWVPAFSRGRGCSLLACMAILQVFGSSVDIPTSFVRCGGSSLGDSVCRAAH